MDPMWIGILVGGAIPLTLGCALGWFVNRRIDKGGRTTDPPAPSLIEFDLSLRQALAAKQAENARQHAEWDRELRLSTPPAPDVVWQRRIHKITDFNN